MAYARHSSNNRRSRNSNRNNGNRNGNRRPQARLNQVYDSNGPEGRVRGTATQIVEKYTTLARDAGASGNKVLQQSFLQHAEHYQRILSEIQKEIEQDNNRRSEQQSNKDNHDDDNDDNNNNVDDRQKPTAKKTKSKSDDKMTEVPGFLSDNNGEKKTTKPRGRKPKTEKTEKKETVEAEPEPA